MKSPHISISSYRFSSIDLHPVRASESVEEADPIKISMGIISSASTPSTRYNYKNKLTEVCLRINRVCESLKVQTFTWLDAYSFGWTAIEFQSQILLTGAALHAETPKSQN